MPYVDEGEPLDATNAALLERVDLLRELMEAVLQQRISFKGEPRPASGPVVRRSRWIRFSDASPESEREPSNRAA